MNSNIALKNDRWTAQSLLSSSQPRTGFTSISAELAARTQARREAQKMFEKVKAQSRGTPLPLC